MSEKPRCLLWVEAQGPLPAVLREAASRPHLRRVAFSRLQSILDRLIFAKTWHDLYYYFLNNLYVYVNILKLYFL